MTSRLRLLKSAPHVRREHDLNAKDTRLLRKLAVAVVSRRIELCMTRRQLSVAVGVSYGQLSHIENAENWPTMPVYIKIVDALKCGRVPLVT